MLVTIGVGARYQYSETVVCEPEGTGTALQIFAAFAGFYVTKDCVFAEMNEGEAPFKLFENESGTPIGKFESRISVNRQHIRVFGPGQIFTDLMPVDLDADYVMEIRVSAPRVSPTIGEDPIGPGSTKFLAGIVTIDKDGNVLTSSPGRHRYGLGLQTLVASNGQWRLFRSTFSGVGNDNSQQFRPATAFIRGVIFANFESAESAIMDIDYIRIWKKR